MIVLTKHYTYTGPDASVSNTKGLEKSGMASMDTLV